MTTTGRTYHKGRIEIEFATGGHLARFANLFNLVIVKERGGSLGVGDLRKAKDQGAEQNIATVDREGRLDRTIRADDKSGRGSNKHKERKRTQHVSSVRTK